ncbi:hypothetical protein FW781_04650 (plasmid) [Chryseobacterium panacisoli]|uniref:Uncharacterized protein n=1 Tax=Chryseobacterium panacisoli TaxID=1807141 RepID=A0A5D8ZXF8_9FLAO|nr:hypothetical protein [Chryseobacterium panacisoli]TZF99220.1 hypothetical protein FW781_04650 [Chryseobacterium panacisoli]
MKAAKPVEKDNKAHQNQRQNKPVVVHQSEAKVSGVQIPKSGNLNIIKGSGNSNNNTVGANGTTPMVHGSQTIYDQGSEIMYKKQQESLAKTGDPNHPETRDAEKGYLFALNINQVQDYHDVKPETYQPKEQTAESQILAPELVFQAGGKERVTHKGDVYTLHFDTYKTDEFRRSIDTNYKLDRYAERMIFGEEVNHSWTPEFENAYVQKLVSSGGTADYRKSDYKGVVGGKGTGNGEKSGKESGEENTTKPNQEKTLEELKSELAKLPNEIKKLIKLEKGNLKPSDYQRLLVIAQKLKQLSQEDIALFQLLTLKATDNIELFEKAVDLFLAKKEELKALSEQAQAANVPQSMQEAIEGSWNGFDENQIGKISESDQYDLAREQTTKATGAQLQYMKDHPGEVIKDFAKAATLMNTPEAAEAIEKDIQEAANGDVNAWQRLAAGLGAGAKISGWLLAAVCIVAVIALLTGVGEVAAVIATIVEVLLYTTITLSALESEARIKAASQAKDANTFKENVNQAASARANFIVALAMLGLAKAAGFIAKTYFPKTLAKIGESVKNFRAKLREMIGLDNFAAVKNGFLTELENNKQSLIQSGEQAKQNAVQTANELAQMDIQTFIERLDKAGDDFYVQATTQNGQATTWKAISQTPEGLKGIETYKEGLLQELRTEVPQHIDALIQEQVQAVNKMQEGVKLAKDTEACDAVLQEYEKFISKEEVGKRANEKQIEITKNLSEKALREIDDNLKKSDIFEEKPKQVDERLKYSEDIEGETPKYIIANEKAKQLIANAELEKELVQADLLNLAKETGGKMEGLDFAIKGEESLTRKIYDRTQDRHIEKIGIEKAINKVASKMNDVLRFTITFEPKVYVENYFKIVKELEAKGYKKTKAFNAWFQGDGSYRGLNVTFETPNGQQFELQFHTNETFRVKSETHDLYEASRAADATAELKATNNAKQAEAYKNIETPKNIDLLKNE